MDSDRESGESLERRVASLEVSVRELAAELRRLRTGSAATPAPAPAALRPPSATGPEPSLDAITRAMTRLDVEALVGRYGTLVLATISGLAAVGTFIGWAISRGWLGPSQRVLLGLILALGLGVAGFRLRVRERSFGATLLGLALAIVHVCAWGAGPSLHLVPDWVAFVMAAVTSIALAIFAHGEADEPLWSVGFSGAAIAPFVTSSGKSNLALLAAYGVAVLSAAGFAMGGRRWIVAGRLFLLAGGVYVAALATGFERDSGPLLAIALPLLVAIAGVLPWTTGWPRRERLRAFGALATLAALRSGFGTDFPYDHATVASLIAFAGIVWLVLVDRTHAMRRATDDLNPRRYLHEGDWLDAAVLPLGFVLGAVIAMDASARTSGIALAAAALLLLVSVARFPAGSLRDAAAFAAALCAVVAAMLLLKNRNYELAVTIAGLSVACFAANVMWRSATWNFMGLLGLLWATLAALVHLTVRVPYRYQPFWTQPSAVAAAVLVAIVLSWRLARDQRVAAVLRGATFVWAFLWVHQEIASAFSPMVATLLRVSYYAATSVAAVWVGRASANRTLRHVGLALAVLAAGTALYGASNLDAIGARITADLVAAVFLLAIAYWYRKPGAAADDAAPGNASPGLTAPPSPASPSDT